MTHHFRSLIFLIILSSTVFANGNSASGFSSSYFDTTKDCACSEKDLQEGQDCTQFKCKSFEGYQIQISYDGSACDLGKLNISKNEGFKLETIEEVPAKLEFRMKESKPFAVIFRLKGPSESCFDSKKVKLKKQSLVVRGLDGHASISGEVDAKSKDSNLKAREIADKGFSN